MFRSGGCSLLRAKGFSCIFDVIHVGLDKKETAFFTQKIYEFFSAVKFLQGFGHQNPRSASALKPMLIHNTDINLLFLRVLYSW